MSCLLYPILDGVGTEEIPAHPDAEDERNHESARSLDGDSSLPRATSDRSVTKGSRKLRHNGPRSSRSRASVPRAPGQVQFRNEGGPTVEKSASTWLTADEAAERTRFGAVTIQRACRRGEIPGAKKRNGQWRIPERGLDAWMMAGESGAPGLQGSVSARGHGSASKGSFRDLIGAGK